MAPDGRVLRLAPRAVPRALRWRLMFGGWGAVFVWASVVVSLAIALVFLPMVDLGLAALDRQATATLTSVEPTSLSEGDRDVHRVRYTFVDEAGVARRGESYTTDPPAGLGPWQVDYPSGDPSASRLYGMRRSLLPPILVLLAAPAIIALGVALWWVLRVRRRLWLLRHGAETRGKLVRKRETNVTVDDVPIMALTFEYEVGGRQYFTTVKTLTPRPLEDDAREAMLYDPRSPSRATTLDHLPGSPKVTAGGDLEARLGTVAHLLILPVLSVGLLAATVIRMLL